MRTIRINAGWLPLSLLVILTADAAATDLDGRPGKAVRPLIAIIIDDLGNQRVLGERAIALPGPVACSVIPGTAYGTYLAEQANAVGKEVILHLPMQAMQDTPHKSGNQAADQSPLLSKQYGITLDTNRVGFNEILSADLAFVPHTVGVNNHMGSLITRHPGHMQWLMEELLSHGDLFFIDSYTSPASIAYDIALENGVPAARRDIFLDNEKSAENIMQEFERLKREARRRGYAIAIGHPNAVTLAFLERVLPGLFDEGFELVPVSRIVALSAPAGLVRRAEPVKEADAS
jgi:polysaccharide deacetylase 2 family uncharacterized protein YibQ